MRLHSASTLLDRYCSPEVLKRGSASTCERSLRLPARAGVPVFGLGICGLHDGSDGRGLPRLVATRLLGIPRRSQRVECRPAVALHDSR
eukprot:9035690-Pyramimonas_sp.AAC.1